MSSVPVRPATPADRPHIDAVESAAFGDHGAAVLPLIRELRRTEAAVLELVAEIDAAVVGHLILSRGWVDASARLVPVRVLRPLAVRPDRQRQGVGRALIEHAVDASEAARAPAVFLEGDPAYYSRVGFVSAQREGFSAPSTRIPEPAFQVRLLTAHEPWMTGALVYPEAFWTMDSVGLRGAAQD